MPVIRAVAICGANGFIGASVLCNALINPAIERVFVIVRKPFSVPIPAVGHRHGPDVVSQQRRKVSLIILQDFSNWPQDVLDQLKSAGVRACIWCIGGPVSAYPDAKFADRVNAELPLTALQALSGALAPAAEGTFSRTSPTSQTSSHTQSFSFYSVDKPLPFRFVYFSVAGAERNPAASLWTQAATRKCKGAAEKCLFDFADAHAADIAAGLSAGGSGNAVPLEVYALRLGRVVPGGQTTANVLLAAVGGGVNVERVGSFAIDMVAHGRRNTEMKIVPGSAVLENTEVMGEDWAQINTLGS